MRSTDQVDKVVDLEAVKRAFKALRRQGVIAHVASGGCRCCYSKDSDQADKVPTAWGSANVWRADLDEHPAGAYVRFGEVDGRGKTTEDVGQAIVAALAAEGVSTTWDGNGGTCIWIEGAERPDTQAAWDACHVMDGALGNARAAVQDAVRDVGCKALGMPVRERAGLLASAAYLHLCEQVAAFGVAAHAKARAWDKALGQASDRRMVEAHGLLVTLDKAAKALEVVA